ncbi:MAG: ferredoxin [Eubacteriales bacterium]|jgi:ferredoxin|nr:ferredoxin [Eubacteriales bacterium]
MTLKRVIQERRTIMKYKVNDECIGCGMCEATCPEVFSLTDEGVAKAIEDEVPADAEASAAEAKDSCPVGAIEEA